MDDDPEQLGLTISIDIDTVSPQWTNEVSRLSDLFQQWSLLVGDNLALKNHYSISVVLCDDDYIHRLNRNYRQKDQPTNILSFPSGLYNIDTDYPDDYIMPLGDLVISYDTLLREAEDQYKLFDDHLCHLWIHGLLHLIGFDHEDDEEAMLMEKTEVILLNQLCIPNPYQNIEGKFHVK